MTREIEDPDEVAARLRTLWFESVAEISDISLQRNRWVDPANENPHWSYIEFACSYPDLDQLTDARERGWLTAGQFHILSDLGHAISSYSAPNGDDYDNAAVLADPAWLDVVERAQRARMELLYMPTNERVRDVISGGEEA